MYFYLMAKALKNEVVLDFLKNLKMGERVIQEIKNKEKEKDMHQHTDENGKPIKYFNNKNEKDMEDEKIEISVPSGYKLIQDGLEIKFVKKPDSRLLKWEDKETALSGCFIGANSTYNHTSGLDGSSNRNTSNRNTFKTVSQAVGSINLAVLTQQLADFNEGWEPEWFNSDEAKYCISREFNGDGSYSFNINLHYKLFRFLAFKTRREAEVFLKINIDEIETSKDFI
jgi:hypothetical protein